MLSASVVPGGIVAEISPGKHDGKLPDIEVSDPQTGEVFYIEVTHLEKISSTSRTPIITG